MSGKKVIISRGVYLTFINYSAMRGKPKRMLRSHKGVINKTAGKF